MSYGQQPRGYGQQSDLQVGMPVSSDNGWTGTITEIIPAAPGYEGAVRVAWNGDGTTLVALATFVVENGQAVIRSQPPPPPPPVAPPIPEPAVPEDDLRTRLSDSPRTAQNDPSHVNPYVSDPPLVTNEPPPIHPTHGGQMHDDMTYIPPVARPEPGGAARPADLEATYVPPRDTPPAPRPEATGGAMPSDFEATYIPPHDTPAPNVRPIEERPTEPYAPPYPMESAQPDTGLTTPLDAMDAPRPDAMMIEPEQREITVPVVEEQVEAHPEWRDVGAIAVRTVTEEIPQTLTQETQREELFVERVAIGRELAEGEEVAPHDEGDTYVIPVVVEEAVVVTRRILAEELRITKRIVPTMQTVQTVVRKERVEIDAGDLADRVHDDGRR